ncbi:MAG: phenylacetate--CoA ligase family protein [Hyphomicrobiaceae bacterium]
MGEHFDSLETRAPAARETSQFARLPDLIRNAMTASGWAAQLGGTDAAAITSREALAALPLLRKDVLHDRQTAHPPLGGFATGPAARLFASPGPIYEPQGTGTDFWRAARALHAAGFRREDIVHNTFAYHLTPGGWVLDSGCRALGCTVIPAGTGNTEQQLDAIEHLKPTAYVGVPDFLKILLDKAAEAGKDASSIKRAFASGGALFPSLRDEYTAKGISCLQAYATADTGMIAYESRTADGVCEGMNVDEDVIVEIVRPGTGTPVPDGDVGEVVVTVFNRDYPMIRFATGDMSAVLAEPSPCGRTNMRIKGWMGRADQTAKVKGMFIRPEQIAGLAEKFPDAGRMRLVVTRTGEQDAMSLHVESAPAEGLAERLTEALQSATKLNGTVILAEPGSLPNDGQIIVDERSYD